MNAQLIERARAAYRAGDFAAAAQMFSAAKDPSEVAGEIDHLRGNALMKIGLYRDASQAYTQALADEAYGTPYKAYLGLGAALRSLGRMAEAGTAFRQAALDNANPAPAAALAQLGDCFVKLGRAGDAVETYRTALDFCGPRDDARSINAGMGQALAAAGRFADAVDAFTTATSDGIYQLDADQQADLARCQDALDAASAQNAMAPAQDAVAGASVDPLDPLGKSGAFMPDPSDTGFFTMSESELIQQDRRKMKVRRKSRHVGLKIVLAILVIAILAAGGLGFAYTRGLGIPSQQDALTGLFQAVTDGSDTDSYLAPALSESDRSMIVSSIPEGATPTIEAMDQSMTESTARVSVQLSMGGTQEYEVTFARSSNYIGWTVSSISIEFGASDGADAAATTDGSAVQDGSGDASADAAQQDSAGESADEPAEGDTAA